MPKDLQDKIKAALPREKDYMWINGVCSVCGHNYIQSENVHECKIYDKCIKDISLEAIHKIYQDYFKEMIEARDTRMLAYYKSALEGFEGGYPKEWDDFFTK